MKSITEYLVNNHISHISDNVSPYNLVKGDYLRIEWENDGLCWLIGRFNRYIKVDNKQVILFDYIIQKPHVDANISIKMNYFSFLTNDRFKLEYKRVSDYDIGLLKEVNNYICSNKLDKKFKDIISKHIGDYINGKIISSL